MRSSRSPRRSATARQSNFSSALSDRSFLRTAFSTPLCICTNRARKCPASLKSTKLTHRKIYRAVTAERLFDQQSFQHLLKDMWKTGIAFAGFFPFSTSGRLQNVENCEIYSLYSHFQPFFQHSLPCIPPFSPANKFNTVPVHVSTDFQRTDVQRKHVTVSLFFQAASQFLRQQAGSFHFSTVPAAPTVYYLFM